MDDCKLTPVPKTLLDPKQLHLTFEMPPDALISTTTLGELPSSTEFSGTGSSSIALEDNEAQEADNNIDTEGTNRPHQLLYNLMKSIIPVSNLY